MKNYKIKIALFSLGVATLLSCNKVKNFGDTNVNPANITSPATYAILTNVLAGAGTNTGIWPLAKDNSATLWIQYASETQYPSAGLYAIPTYGLGAYTGSLLNLKTIIQANNNPDEVAVARILTQYIYWNLTDALGSIPYSEALQGFPPKFDKQEDIYKGMIAELTAASNQIQNTGGLKGDILLGNDAAKWKKFANSLRAMMAIQLTKRYPGANDYAAVEFRAAITDGVITSNADNVKLVFPGGSFKNQYWADHDGQRDNGESTQIFNMLSSLGDGRQAAFGSSSVPVPHGIKEATINAWIKANINWSRILADNQRLETSPIYILTASQVFLARSEAAFRGWTGPGAPGLTTENSVDLLKQGVDASFAQWGIALPPASYYNAPHTLQKIVEQAFLAGFPNGRAGWNIYRRTGFPVLTPAPDPLNAAHTTIPRRYTYTTTEYSLSPAGVAFGISQLVPAADTQEARIWWDQ